MTSLWLRVTSALLFAMFISGLLATRSFVAFAPTRVRLLKTSTPAEAGSVAASATEQSAINQLHVPFAAIVRIKNESATAGAFHIEIDGQALCDGHVAALSSRRIDCVASEHWTAKGPHTVVIKGPLTAWSAEYIELATHFGASHGLVDLYIVPAGRAVEPAGLAGAAGAGAIVMFMVLGIRPARWRLAIRVVYGVLAAIVAVLFIGVWIAPWVSIYRLVLSPDTIRQLTAVLFAPRLWTIASTIWRLAPVVRLRRSPLARQAAVALLVVTAFALVVRSRLDRTFDGNYSGFLIVARDNFDRNPMLNQRADIRASVWLQESGYDAEFMYFEVFDPFIRVFHDTPKRYGEFIDFPPYRYSRIGFSLLTKVVTLDRWQWYPAGMIWLILAGLFASSFILGGIARDQGASPLWGATVLLVPGFWRSLQSGLPEPLAVAWLLGGYWALTRRHWLVAGACFAASLLTRETDIVIIGLLLAWDFFSGRRREAFLAGLVAVAPLAAWRTYVGLTFFQGWGWDAFFPSPNDLETPFKGLVDLRHMIATGAYFHDIAVPAILFAVLMIAACALAVAFAIRRPSALTLANLFYVWVAICFSYGAVWLHVGNAERITYELFILLALGSIESSRTRGLRWAVYGFWAASALYVFAGTYEADFIRQAILLSF